MQYFDKVKKQNFSDDSESQKAFNFHKHLKNKLNSQLPFKAMTLSKTFAPTETIEKNKIAEFAEKVIKKL